MGCDIHLYVEKRVNGVWKRADKGTGPFYSGRNYDLFAILADVRNGHGFAGVDTGDGFEPIAPPRGLPKDVSTEVEKEAEGWGGDGHSHSWFTVAELLAYDWTKKTKHRGVVDGIQFAEWVRWRRGDGLGPEAYCGNVSGGDVHDISAEEMEKRYNEIKKKVDKNFGILGETVARELKNFYCKVEWSEFYYESASELWSQTIPRLLRVGHSEDVRIVFWFDN